MIVGFYHKYRTTQLDTVYAPIIHRVNTQACIPTNTRSAVNITFLGDRSFLMHLLVNDIVSNAIVDSGSWMPHQTKFISLLLGNSSSKPAVFLDIGANIGWFTLTMAALGHKVIAIEPICNNVALMRASLQASQLSNNVILHYDGLSATSGRCIIHSDNQNIGDGHMVCGLSNVEEMNAVVPSGYSIRQVMNSTRLDALVNQDIDVIKIDVEGSELHAVKSGIRLFDKYRIRHIISEFSPTMMRQKHSDPFEYLTFFVSRGYVIRVMTDHLSDLYRRNDWRTQRTYRSDDDLRQLSNHDGIRELWFSKN